MIDCIIHEFINLYFLLHIRRIYPQKSENSEKSNHSFPECNVKSFNFVWSTMTLLPNQLLPQASSPGSVYSSTGPSNSLTWGTTFSSSSAQSRESTLGGHGGTGSVGYPSVSSMHTSSESIDMSLGSHGTHREDTLSALGRTGSVKTGMSERWGHATRGNVCSPWREKIVAVAWEWLD